LNILSAELNASTARRVLLHLEEGRRVPVDPSEVFFLEADGDRTEVRTRGKRRLRDLRSMAEVLALFPPGVLVAVHRGYAVNVDRVDEIRRRAGRGRDWEVKLEPPVNRVLPVSRTHLAGLWSAYGEG
jgi:DNA-binding LytR/AlgR family response regulator